MTRVFTGGPARALVNDFVHEFDEIAPAVYPHLHYLTAPLRTKAKDAGDESLLNLWVSPSAKDSNLPSASVMII